jgi:hypothetical protein
MHPRTQELLNFLETSRIRLREAVEAVPPERREAPPQNGRWSVAQVIEHLAKVESGIARLIRRRVGEAKVAGLAPETEISSVLWSLDVGRVVDRRAPLDAPDRVRPGADLTVEDAWRAFESAHDEARQSVAETDGLAIGALSHPHPSLGPLNLYQWIIFLGAHELRHAMQIRER